MSILDKIEAEGRSALTAVEHAAIWLVAKVATAEQSLSSLSATSELVKNAWETGLAWATKNGIPVGDIEDIGQSVLTTAQDLATNLASAPAPSTAPVQPAPDPAQPSAPEQPAAPVQPAPDPTPTQPSADGDPDDSDAANEPTDQPASAAKPEHPHTA